MHAMARYERHDTSKPGSFPSFATKQLLQMPGISTPQRLLECDNPSCLPQGDLVAEVLFNPSEMIPGVGEVICVRCDAQWTVCLSCDNLRVQRFAPGISRSLQDHLRKLHRPQFDEHLRTRQNLLEASRSSQVSNPPNLAEGTSLDLDTETSPSPDLASPERVDPQERHPQEDEDLPPPLDPVGGDPLVTAPNGPVIKSASDISSARRYASREYFFRNQTGEGIPYLVSRAQFGLPNIPPGELDPKEVRMLLQAAELASSLPRNENAKLASYTKSVVEVVRKQTLEAIEVTAKRQKVRPWAILPITSSQQMRRQTKNGSKDSIMYTLPHPEVVTVGAHAISRPSDCLQDLVGHGFPLDFVPSVLEATHRPDFPVTGPSSTFLCKNLFPDHGFNDVVVAEYNVWIIEWSDDFEPNSSLTKSNRGGVWVKTITICPPRSYRHLQAYSYPVAMGPKNVSHEEAEIILQTDMKKLAATEGALFYSPEHGGLIRIRAKLFVSLQDQPERRGQNYLTSGSFSTYHRRFGYSFKWQDFGPVLRPCSLCREALFDTTLDWRGRECGICTNFAHDPQHPLLVYDHVLVDDVKQGVIKLTYAKLADAANIVHDGYVCGEWTSTDANEWLKIHCIVETCRKSILLHADKCKEYRDIMDESSTASDTLKAAINQEKARYPHLYKAWPLPTVWTRGVHLHQHPDVPMHLICLGVVKSVILRVDKWMTNSSKSAPFVRHMKGMLESIQELGLCWCPILPYKGGKFGGWVSENYLTMSRLLKWFYGVLDDIAPDEAPWSEPTASMSDWTGKDCKMWLKIRGQPQAGFAAECRAKVSLFRAMPIADQPPVIERRVGPVEKVQEMIVALDDLVSWLMVDQIDDESYYFDLERKIRIFLTLFAEMDEKLAKKDAIPAWLTAYNFLSLLNLPDIVRLYGPVRNIWEGSWVGEGFLRFIKPAMIHGLRKNWETSTMTSLMRMKAMQHLTKGLRGGSNDDAAETSDNGKKSYYRYASIVQVDDTLRTARAVISAVIVEGRLGVACEDLGETRFLPLSRRRLHIQKLGHCYFQFVRELKDVDQEPYATLGNTEVQLECLLLPLLQMAPPGDARYVLGVYTVIDRSHRWIDHNGVLRR